MKSAKADFGWGVVVNFNKKTNVKVSWFLLAVFQFEKQCGDPVVWLGTRHWRKEPSTMLK